IVTSTQSPPHPIPTHMLEQISKIIHKPPKPCPILINNPRSHTRHTTENYRPKHAIQYIPKQHSLTTPTKNVGIPTNLPATQTRRAAQTHSNETSSRPSP